MDLTVDFMSVKKDTVILIQEIVCAMAIFPLCLQLLSNIHTCSNGETTEELAWFI